MRILSQSQWNPFDRERLRGPAIRKLKNNKAEGEDKIVREMFKTMPNETAAARNHFF